MLSWFVQTAEGGYENGLYVLWRKITVTIKAILLCKWRLQVHLDFKLSENGYEWLDWQKWEINHWLNFFTLEVTCLCIAHCNFNICKACSNEIAEYWASSFLHFYTQRQNMFLIEQALPLTDNYSYINIAGRKVFLVVTILALKSIWVAESEHKSCLWSSWLLTEPAVW